MRSSVLIAVLVAGLGACKKDKETGDKKPPPTAGKTTSGEVDETPDRAPDKAGIRWIKDDYPAAIAAARKANKPLVIDMWAPWCHTCLSMKHTVLVDAGLAEMADRFVWLALDTDRETNAPAVARFPPAAWPTFFVVTPDEAVASRFVGSASVNQFRSFLVSGEKAMRESAQLDESSPDWQLREGDRLASAGKPAEAAAAYARALAAAPADWPRRADVLVSQIGALYKAGDKKACAELGAAKIGETLASRSASTADMAYYASTCAASLDDKKAAAAINKKLLGPVTEVLSDEAAHLSVDDRSDGWRIVREIHLALGDEAAAKKAAETQRAILDKAAAEAPGAHAAMTYNWPRAEVYVYLDKGAELVSDLAKSAKALPREYDPPYRLAWVLHKIGKSAEARPHAARAVELVYGPRKARAMSLLAEITEATGDAAGARAIREKMVAHVESLPEGQRSESLLAWAKKQLEPEAAKK